MYPQGKLLSVLDSVQVSIPSWLFIEFLINLAHLPN